MRYSELLSLDPDELEARLRTAAQRDRAPAAARERALSRALAVSVGAAAGLSTKAALAAAPSAGRGAVLAFKWGALGLGTAFLGLTALDRLERALEPTPNEPARASAPVALGSENRSRELPSGAPPAGGEGPPVMVRSPAPVNHGPAPMRTEPVLPVADASPSAEVVASASASQLTREVAALREARTALVEGKAARAGELLSGYRREFRGGVLGTEAAALEVEIAFALGEARAPELGQRFLSEHPTSPLAARVRVLLEAPALTNP